MKRRVKPLIIGSFVVGAVAIAALAIIVFGSGELLSKRYKHVAYFQGSVSGLDVGVPVTFRGVDIGQVTAVQARLSPEVSDVGVEVVFEIDPEKVSVGAPITSEEDYWALIEDLIQKGLRAKIETQSFLTGRRYIDLVFRPDTPVVLQGINPDYHEFPTTQTTMEQLREAADRAIDTVSDLPIEDVLNQLLITLEQVDEFMDSDALIGALTSVQTAMDSMKATSGRFDSGVESVVAKIHATADSLQFTMREFRESVYRMEGVTSEESALHYEIMTALEELERSARAVRLLAEYLERHPEALLVGREKREEP